VRTVAVVGVGLFLLTGCGGSNGPSSPHASKIVAHLRQLAATRDFRQVPAGGVVSKSATTRCGDTERDPTTWRQYRVPSAEAAVTELSRAWTAAGWHADHRSNLPGDLTVAKSFGNWTAGLSAFVVDATHVEVTGNDLGDHCYN
jgi:hypothetical protein